MITNKSITFDKWVEEMKEETYKYYSEKKEIYLELRALTNKVRDYERAVQLETYDSLGYDSKAYTHMVNTINNNDFGLEFDAEHYVLKRGNGTPYTVLYNGKKLHNTHYGYNDETGRRFISYTICAYYFYNYESASVYDLVDNSRKDLKVEADKEIDRYVKNLIARIEKRYGKVLEVKDTNKSNVENVEFICEKGVVYLEKILAGGYNIQRLHSRLLIKESK